MRMVWHNCKARFAMLLRRKCCFVPRHETTELTSALGFGCVKTRRRAAVIEQTFGRQPLGYASVPKEARSQLV